MLRGEHHHEDEHEEYLSDDGRRNFVLGRASAFHFFVEGVEYTVGVVVDDLASVYDLLPAHHHAAG